jgi:hypothetical protein
MVTDRLMDFESIKKSVKSSRFWALLSSPNPSFNLSSTVIHKEMKFHYVKVSSVKTQD